MSEHIYIHYNILVEDLRLIYGEIMDDTWILGKGYLILAQTIYLLYKQGSNISETPY